MKFLAPSLAILLPLSVPCANASSSDWVEMEGARVRLVTAGMPDAEGRLRGILDIALEPGWKTYWRDPGESGVPPTIDVSASPDLAGATFDFPAPQWHNEADFQWAGYDYPVGFPVTFTVKDGGTAGVIDANIFIGVCETICVPLQAKLSVDPGRDPDNAADAAAVEAAFASLPKTASDAFGVKVVSEPGAKEVLLEASFPGDPAKAELFIASEDGYTFSTPVRHEKDGKTVFSAEVLLPARLGTGPGLPYTLATDKGAVSGFLPYF